MNVAREGTGGCLAVFPPGHAAHDAHTITGLWGGADGDAAAAARATT